MYHTFSIDTIAIYHIHIGLANLTELELGDRESGFQDV